MTSVTILARRQHQPATARSALIEKWRPRSQDSLQSLLTHTSSSLWFSSFAIIQLQASILSSRNYQTCFWVQEQLDLPPHLDSLDPQPLLYLLFSLLWVTDISQDSSCDCSRVMTPVIHQHEVTNLSPDNNTFKQLIVSTCLATEVRGVENLSQNVELPRWDWTIFMAIGTSVAMMISGSSSDGTYSSPAIRLNFRSLDAWSLNTMILGDCRL